ncbi:MAG: hypothetical protein PVJ68_10660, partial [Candidatus Thiodiazotropha sp.]
LRLDTTIPVQLLPLIDVWLLQLLVFLTLLSNNTLTALAFLGWISQNHSKTSLNEAEKKTNKAIQVQD